MNWGSREECHCPSTVWGGKNCRPRWYRKKVLDTLSNFALKTRYLIFQHKSLFNLIKDFFKWIEGLGWSVTVQVQPEEESIFDLGGIRKKYLIRCQISLSNSLYSVSTEIAFQPSEGLIQMNWGSKEECHYPSTVWGGKNFRPRWYRKKVLDTLSNFALKTRYLIFQHKSLFNLIKDFFKWIEGLGWSVTVQVQSEGERIFDLGGIGKKYLIRCQISRSKTGYIVFQHKSLFNPVKDLFKWIEGLGRSVTTRVQSEGERIFDLGGIGKKYLIRCQISRSKLAI